MITAGAVIAFVIFAVPAAYQLVALIACLRQLLQGESTRMPSGDPPVSILKPVRGSDAAFYEAIRSHAAQNYREFEILFGYSNPSDPAITEIERLQREYPDVPIRLIHTTTVAPNAKVGVLIELAQYAQHPVLIVNDGDIRVPQGYVSRVIAPLIDPAVGLVTCLYTARADSLPGWLESLGIATDFAPSALVAPLVGVNEFGMGATLAFRRTELDAIGGFEAIAPYIADDYQLGKMISRLGKQVVLSKTVVETHLHANSWLDVWEHQLRWARTIRLSRGGGYAGLPITNATLWAVVLLAAGYWQLAIALLSIRLFVGIFCAAAALQWQRIWTFFFWMPIRDLFGFAIWLAGLTGDSVRWGDSELRLDSEGRIK